MIKIIILKKAFLCPIRSIFRKLEVTCCAPLNWWGQKKRVGEEIRRINSGLLPPTPRLTFPDAPIGGDLRALLENQENRHTALNWRERSNGQKPPGLVLSGRLPETPWLICFEDTTLLLSLPINPLLVLLWFGLSPPSSIPKYDRLSWWLFLTENNNFVYLFDSSNAEKNILLQ